MARHSGHAGKQKRAGCLYGRPARRLYPSRSQSCQFAALSVHSSANSQPGQFMPRPAGVTRPASANHTSVLSVRRSGTGFATYPVSCGTATAVRFLHLFKFGLVVSGGQSSGRQQAIVRFPAVFVCFRLQNGLIVATAEQFRPKWIIFTLVQTIKPTAGRG